jgi:tetratricopeptide (TPR) repeat protein
MFKSRVLVMMFMVLVASCVFADTYNASSSLSLEEQTALAKELNKKFDALSYKEIKEIKALHKEIIEKCPLTESAQQSCWMLSNIFVMKDHDHKAAIEVLEHLFKQHPDTKLKERANNRLLACYEEVGSWDKVCAIYKDLLKDEPNAKNEKSYISRCSLYAKALDRSGNKEEAKKWYQKIIDLDKGRSCLEARGAKKYLENNK